MKLYSLAGDVSIKVWNKLQSEHIEKSDELARLAKEDLNLDQLENL